MLQKRTRLILFWIIMALILFARVFLFGKVPGGINQDEALAGYNAYTLLHDGKDSFGYPFPMYLTAWGSGMNALETYLMIPFVAIFGLNIASVRIVPLIIAVLSLVALYRMIRENLEDDVLALFTLFFAGIMPWHIMISRWALESNLAPGFMIFGMYFFLKGMKDQKFYIVSALMYGLSLYCYATVWMVMPFIVLFQVGYAIIKRKLKFSGYTVTALIVLFLMALPSMLFLMVNKGWIDEIVTPVFSIPRMVSFRGDEVSLSYIPDNFKTLMGILLHQTDDLIWNASDQYGIIYLFSLPFFIFGLIAAIAPAFTKKEEGRMSAFHFCMLMQLLAGFCIGILVNCNINRVNILLLPLIVFTAYGWYAAFYKREFRGLRLDLLPVGLYLACFISFEIFYFTDYREQIGDAFYEGLGDCFETAERDLVNVEKVYVTQDVCFGRAMFYSKIDLAEYLETVEYINYPSPYLDVSSFGHYVLEIDRDAYPEEGAVYIIGDYDADSPLVSALWNMGYELYESKGYQLYYPANLKR